MLKLFIYFKFLMNNFLFYLENQEKSGNFKIHFLWQFCKRIQRVVGKEARKRHTTKRSGVASSTSRRAEKRLTFVNNSPQHNYESPQPGSCKSLARPRLFFSLSSLAFISRAHQTEAGCPSYTRPSSRFLILF